MKKTGILCLALCAVALMGCDENVVTSGLNSGELVAGPQGEKGNSVLTGEGAPDNTLGKDGDSYIDLTTFDFYTKENDTWTKKGSIKGADGADGFNGKPGANGKNGKDGLSFLSGKEDPDDTLGVDGDLYINTETFDIFKKEEGTWTKTGNVKGEKGEKGEDAIPYYSNTFLPSEGGYLYCDKGSYAAGETIKLTSFAESSYELKSVEAIYNGVKSIYTAETGLSDLLANGLKAKENGYVFKGIYAEDKAPIAVTDITKIGENGSGTYALSDSYGEASKGIALSLSAKGKIIDIQGKTDEEGKPITTIYVNKKSTFNSAYLTLKNINFVLASDYVDAASILEFDCDYANFENCTITVDKAVNTALNFKAGNFSIKDSKINTSKEEDGVTAKLTTAVTFGETKATQFSRVFIDNFTVNDVKKLADNGGPYAGSVFKSFYDTPYFDFEIKDSTFGTTDTPIREIWSHFRQQDYISDRFGMNSKLYAKYMKTASVKLDSVNFYTDIKNDDSWYRNPALFTFRMMQNESDDDYNLRRNFADILFEVTSSKANDASLTASNVQYGVSNTPLTTLYLYNSSDEVWNGNTGINVYQAVYPYATIDGQGAKLASGLYPDI